MIFFKVCQSRRNLGAMPLFQAIFLDGAIFYCLFTLAFLVEVIATASNEVGVHYHYPVR